MVVRVSLLWSGQTSSVGSGSTGHSSFTRSPDLWATPTAIGKLWSVLEIVWRGCLVARQLGNSLWGRCFHSIQWDFPDLRSAATAVLKLWAIGTHVYIVIPLKFCIFKDISDLVSLTWSYLEACGQFSVLPGALALVKPLPSVKIASMSTLALDFPTPNLDCNRKDQSKSAAYVGVPVPKACPPRCLWLLWCGQERVPSHPEKK